MNRTLISLFAATCLIAGGTAVGQDEVNIGGLTRQGTVIGVDDGQVVYRTGSGDERQVALAEVQQITIEGRDDFNAGEAALAEGQFAQAAQKYAAATRTTREAWARQLIDLRRMQALDGAGPAPENCCIAR